MTQPDSCAARGCQCNTAQMVRERDQEISSLRDQLAAAEARVEEAKRALDEIADCARTRRQALVPPPPADKGNVAVAACNEMLAVEPKADWVRAEGVECDLWKDLQPGWKCASGGKGATFHYHVPPAPGAESGKGVK